MSGAETGMVAYQKVSEYDQELPQPQTADQPTAPWGRATGHLQLQDIQKTTKNINQLSLFLVKTIAKLERT